MSLENFNALVNGNMSDIEDLPDFCNPPTGAYLLLATKATLGERDGKNGKEGELVIQAQVVSCLEDTPSDEQAACAGNLVSFKFFGEFGAKQFKKLFGDVAVQLGLPTIADTLNHMNNGMEFVGMLKSRVVTVDAAKQPLPVDQYKHYTDLKLVTLAE